MGVAAEEQRAAGARKRPGSPLAVWGLTAVLAVTAVVTYLASVRPDRPLSFYGGLPWLLMVAAFAVTNSVVIHVNIGRHAHSFSLADAPLAIAFLLLPHESLITARLVGGAVVLLAQQRQQLVKLAFNLAQWSLGLVAALVVWDSLSGGSMDAQRSWLAVVAAVLTVEVVSALSISAVIVLSGGRVERGDALRGLATGAVTGIANTSFVLIAVAVIHTDWRGLWAVAVVAAYLAAAQRSHVRLQKSHGALERLNEAARRLGRDLQADAIAQEILTGAARALHAATASLELVADDSMPAVSMHYDGTDVTVAPGDPTAVPIEAMRVQGRARTQTITAPLRAHSKLLGYLSVSGPAEVPAFGADEQHLLDTLAQHASTALTNGRLADQLRVQVADNERQATHDPLTGLPNRLMFERVVTAMLQRGRPLAVLLLDLDRFKDVNDTLGHAAGDALLRDVGERLKGAVPQALCIARLGGDEFTLLLTSTDLAAATAAATAARTALLNPLEVNSVPVSVDASIGIALAPEHGQTCDDLLRHADVAMYAAKEGRGTAAIYDPSFDHNDASRLGLAAELREAVTNGGIYLNYQPKIDLFNHGCKASVEALARWNHPVRGFVSPDEFIAVAEQTGSIIPLTDAVLTMALRQCRSWLDLGLDMSIAVNVSPRVLRDHAFAARLAGLLACHRVPAARLTLEITESAIMDDAEHAVEVLWQLRKSGVRLSIDDLGIGQSSLSYLKRLPVDEVKMDKSFVLNMADDMDDDAIVCAVVGLAHRLRMSIVAEGVETQRTRDRLVEIGCDVAQGYWYSRPMPAEDVQSWFAGHFETVERKSQLRVAASTPAPRAAQA